MGRLRRHSAAPSLVSAGILFSPDTVKDVLRDLPSVAALLPDPTVEGEPSEAFLELRKTRREVYRWIANTHYTHLAEVVPALERVHGTGCRFGNLLTTTSRERFISHTAEVFVADDLLRRGYTVRTVPLTDQVSPDLHVVSDDVDVAVEVYSPRELIAVDEWVREVSDLLSYVDIRASYTSRIDTNLVRSIPPEREALDPWAPAKMLEETRDEVLAAITADVEESLRRLSGMSKTYRHAGTPLVTTVELDDVEEAPDVGPVRRGSISYPGFSGYSPAGVFRTIVTRSQRKAKRRQTHGVDAPARALVVYLMGTQVAEDLAHPAHGEQARRLLEGAEPGEGIEPRDYGLDVIAFVVRALPEGLAAIFWLLDENSTLTIPNVEAMFSATD
jgi:hypothetical protein